ncbi:MAG: aldo/keto reductase [Candidatus Handelsmanbacteria bacterium]|nr:aldo/keto reductase [Candidatus Handelsmanbacteria bacterium]
MAIPKRLLGKTGAQVTALGLGGVCWNLLGEDRAAVEVLHRAIDRGITYLDTASSYKESERRLGLALKERDRGKLFIATKCLKRSGDELKGEIEESFARLQLETIDLMQVHAIDQERTLSEVLKPDGALRVIEEYRRAGKIRFVGLTGHTHPEIFAKMIQEYDFDTLLNPLGPINRVWNDFAAPTLAAARARGMGIIAMKVMAAGKAPAEDRSLYLRYALTPPVDVAIIGMDSVDQVEENVRVAENFAPLTHLEEKQVLERVLAFIPTAKKDLWWLPEQRLAS